jgi:hypothetical protein
MKDPIALDDPGTTDVEAQLAADKKKYRNRIIILIAINTILFVLIIKDPMSFPQKCFTSFCGNVIGYPMVGFIVGLLVALFPYKGLSYSKKYLRSSLLAIFVIHSLVFGLLIMLGLMTLVGWYK